MNPNLALDFIIATPQMQHYINKSVDIYKIYLKYFSSDDIHVYSIDEVFIDLTSYLKLYKLSERELVKKVLKDINDYCGITATAGIGTNMYLAKVAMDIVAKHIDADKDGVRIAYLDEMSYRNKLWDHKELKDFWRVGRGYINRLNKIGLYTMGDIALCSINNEDLLYETFGINAELLIDHAWGYESCTIKDIKNYIPENKSYSQGQVLSEPYNYEKTKLIVKEMLEVLSLDLSEKKVLTNQIAISTSYDSSNLDDYNGEISKDYYGREAPKHAHGSIILPNYTNSIRLIKKYGVNLFESIYNPYLSSRAVYVAAVGVCKEDEYEKMDKYEQINLFDLNQENEEKEKKEEEIDKKLQKTVLNIHSRYGKNKLVKVADLQEGATKIERNKQIGGHKA